MGKQEEYHLNSIDSIGRLPLSEQVYVTLKQAILTGAIKTPPQPIKNSEEEIYLKSNCLFYKLFT